MDQSKPGPTPSLQDNCPSWAVQLIAQILEVEMRLGNVRPPAETWKSDAMDELLRRTSATDATAADESAAEMLFARVCRGLADEGFGPEEAAAFINARIPTGSRLPYCSAAEVLAALGPV